MSTISLGLDLAEAIPTLGDLHEYHILHLHVQTSGPAGGNPYVVLTFIDEVAARRWLTTFYTDKPDEVIARSRASV